MTQENVQFEFIGFDPSYEVRAFVSNFAEKIYLNSPSDAAIKLAIEKGKGAVKASCRIASQAGTFIAETLSDSPVRAVQQIEQKINHQLNNWKAWRFQQKNFMTEQWVS